MFLELEEVAEVTRRGWRDREIWVEVDPEKLKSLYVSFDDIIRALKERNISIPAGTLRGPEKEYNIRTVGEFITPGEIEEVIIRGNDAGNWLKVKDVATVRETFEEENTMTRSFGRRTINLVVIKKDRADAIKLVDKVKEILKDFKNRSKDKLTVYPKRYVVIY